MSVQERVNEHLQEALLDFPESRVVGIFLQGSQNYGLEVEGSDVDTKLIVAPTFREIAFAKSPISTTHIRANEEHIDYKDVRLMLQTFRKQNLNFVEVLFTQYKWENPLYQTQWERLVREREAVAHYSPYRAVKTMKGIALEKYHAMEHRYPSKLAILDQYGYDPKQVSHLVRVHDFIVAYVNGLPYQECLHPIHKDFILDIKLGKYDLDEARKIAIEYLNDILEIADCFCAQIGDGFDADIEELLNDVQYKIMEIAIKEELK